MARHSVVIGERSRKPRNDAGGGHGAEVNTGPLFFRAALDVERGDLLMEVCALDVEQFRGGGVAPVGPPHDVRRTSPVSDPPLSCSIDDGS